MKIATVVCALAFVVLANGQDAGINSQADDEFDEVSDLLEYTPDLRVCDPGALKKEDCNNCFCTSDGSGWACTRMMCLPLTWTGPPRDSQSGSQSGENRPDPRVERDAPFSCTPNGHFMNDCNHCWCTSDGRSAHCTLMACPPK